MSHTTTENLENFINANDEKIDLYNIMSLAGLTVCAILPYNPIEYIKFLRDNGWNNHFDIVITESDYVILAEKTKE